MNEIMSLDLTEYNGGIVFFYIGVGKLSPSKAAKAIDAAKEVFEPVSNYLHAQGFTVVYVPQPDKRTHRWVIWGMNTPFDKKMYGDSERDFNRAKLALTV